MHDFTENDKIDTLKEENNYIKLFQKSIRKEVFPGILYLSFGSFNHNLVHSGSQHACLVKAPSHSEHIF